jgi:capsular exopolysaccharide synthesis family protein
MVKKQWPEEGTGGQTALRPVRPPQVELRPDLRQALSILWLRKWSILAITFLVVGVALFVSSRQTPIYESTVRILVIPVDTIPSDTVPASEPNLQTEAELINSVAVAQIVAERLNVTGPPRALLGDLSVDQPTDTEILDVSYRSPDRKEAQQGATAFAAAYLEYRTGTATEKILRASQSIDRQVELLKQDFSAINRKLQGLSASDPNRGLLEAQANLLSTQIVQLQLQLTALPEGVSVGRIIQPAPIPTYPVSPNHAVNAIFGLVAGLGLGIGLAFMRDRLSERVRSSEEAEAYLEAPILATIPPTASSWPRRREPLLVTSVQSRSPAAEGYRVLRTGVLSAASAAGVKSIAVTSAYSGEGKSATVANLGVVLARAGKRVCLVSADLRRPRLHEFFQREGEPGLIEVVAGHMTLAQALQEVTLPTRGFDAPPAGLHLLPSGRIPDDHPTELITSETVARVLATLEDRMDIVLIDLPPVLPLTDALVVAAVTKNVLLVIGPRANTRPTITSVRQQLDRVGARILGGIFNRPDTYVGQTYYSY